MFNLLYAIFLRGPWWLRALVWLCLASLLLFGCLHAVTTFRTATERPGPTMSTTLTIKQPALSGPEAVLVDRIGNEVYASHYAERKAYRLVIGCGTVILFASLWTNLSLAHRPIANRYIRIDEMGRAQAIQYTDLDYTPREGEVRTYLTDWANYRYTISRDTIAKKYPLNYYFLSQALASRLMLADNTDHLVSQVNAGQIEQSDDEVKSVTITSMSQELVQGVTTARGSALIGLDRLYSAQNSREPRTEHWMVSATYYLNPKQVSDQARIFPQFETINPLGLTITEFHESRVSVERVQPESQGRSGVLLTPPVTGSAR